MNTDTKWQSKLTYSVKAAELWHWMMNEFEDYSEAFEYEIVEGTERFFEALPILAGGDQTFFWTGDQYLFFKMSERELLAAMRKEEMEIRTYDGDEEVEVKDAFPDLTKPENAHLIDERQTVNMRVSQIIPDTDLTV